MISFALAAALILAANPELDRELALAHFKQAELLFSQARYEEAIAQFEAAYRIRPHGDLFFNLGKCYEQLGDAPKALENYRAYLKAVPDAKDSDLVSAAIAELEQGVEQRLAQPRDAPRANPLAKAQLLSVPSAERDPRGRIFTWISAGSAGAALATAVGLGLGSNAARSEMVRQQHGTEQVQQLHDATADRATGANVAYGVAAVAAVTAIILFFVEPANGAAR